MLGQNRFEIVLEENLKGNTIIICRDRQTGVQYLFMKRDSGGGPTPLLDKDGKPIIN